MTPRVVVVGLGPGDPQLASVAAVEAIAAAPVRYLRTARHPSAHLAEPAESFDRVYEDAPTIEAVYDTIVGGLVAAASEHGEVLYAVPGSPLVAERTVELLRADRRVATEVVPSLSFVDLAWRRLGVDPLGSAAQLVDARTFMLDAAGRSGPFLVGQCDDLQALSAVKLAADDGPEVTVLQRLGLDGESVFRVAWADLDRGVRPDHLTCLWIPQLAAPVAAEIVRFEELVRLLRLRCPWDRRQTHRSLTRHLIEETYEVLEAIDELDSPGGYPHLEEELGDLLFQVAFHATLASEQGEFTLADVARNIHDKLVERHPHVFGAPGSPVPGWEELKRAQKGRTSVMDGVPGNLPSLLYAFKLQVKAADVGFDWRDASGAWQKVDEELGELRAAIGSGEPGSPQVAAELGDLLFSLVNVSRHLGVDPEAALREAAARFRTRYQAMEQLSSARRVPITDELWEEVKGAS